MYRLLIADGTGMFAERLVKELSDEFLVEVCNDGGSTLARLRSFAPDILLLDTVLPGVDSFTVLHAMRASGCSAGVVVMSDLTDPVTLRRLGALRVNCVLSKPCAVNLVISNIRDLAFRMRYPDVNDWCLENEIDNILLQLHFRMGNTRNKCVWHGIRYRYDHPDSSYMKEVCPAVAKRCGGNSTQVEKAIRDAVQRAFKTGDMNIWQMYFPPGQSGVSKCPGGDEFISRIAQCLIQHARIKPPYEPQMEAIK